MINASIVRLHAHVTVNEKDWAVFKQMVAEVNVIVANEGTENVLTHVTYHQSGSFNCLIDEVYANESAFLNHLENIKPLSEKYKVDWKINRLELSGAYSEQTIRLLTEANKENGFAFYNELLS